MRLIESLRGLTGRKKVNRIIMTLVSTNLLFYLAVGLLGPIIAVFYVDQVDGGSTVIAGLAIAVFWAVKSVVQIPVSLYADRTSGERDDYNLMLVGFVIAALVPFLYYLLVREAWQVLMLEVLNGIGYGLWVPTYMAIFTKHLDRRRESFEWTLQSNAVGLGYAAAAAVGGLLAERFGFRVLFLVTSAVMFLAPVALLFIRRDILKSDRPLGL